MKRSTIRNKLDRICGEIVRGRGKCQKCKSQHELQTCHIFSRKFNNTRWDIDNNLLCLCAKCHRWAHDNPILFTEWVRGFLGEDRYELLKESRNQITKFTTDDLQTKLTTLQTMLKELK